MYFIYNVWRQTCNAVCVIVQCKVWRTKSITDGDEAMAKFDQNFKNCGAPNGITIRTESADS